MGEVIRIGAVPAAGRGIPCRRHGISTAAVPAWRRWAGVLVVLALALCTGASLRAQPADAAPRETRDLLRRALNAGAYEQAIPLIQQLIEWFKDSRQASLQRDLEQLRFQLGLCCTLTGSFAEAEKAFAEYLAKHPRTYNASEAAVYLGDCLRLTSRPDAALKQYALALKTYPYNDDWTVDVSASMVRCHLAANNWAEAIPLLERIYRIAPDAQRANWAATLLCTAYLREQRFEQVFRLVPYLMQSDSPAARSVAFNLSALEAGDTLFADEAYREALWVYRLVHPKETIASNTRRLAWELKEEVEASRNTPGMHRQVLRAQEALGEAEAELAALGELPEYGAELRYRIARSYMEIRRFREARSLFLYLRGTLTADQAEEPLYLAFHCSTQLTPWDRAVELGLEYMEAYPAGRFYDAVSLAVGQIHATQREWPQAAAVLKEALEVHPEHESIAECMFLIGYASFMEESFAEAIRWLKDLNTRFPNHDRIDESTYWQGMALLFNRNYEEALRLFERYAVDFPQSPCLEDAAFRHAVCAYGLSLFADAERHLTAFLERYPASALAAEAQMMLADIAANSGALERAVAHYRQAIDSGGRDANQDGKEDLNSELYNHCAFRAGEMLAELQRFDAVVEHFQAYLARNRAGSNLPLAVYWTARGLWQQGLLREAMTVLLDAVDRHGRDPAARGVDLLLEEWVSRSRSLPPAVVKEAWLQLGNRLRRAREEGCVPLQLRLQHLFLYNPALTEQNREQILGNLLRGEVIPDAPPAILEFLMREAAGHGKPELAEQAAERALAAFADTDTVLAARMVLGERAIVRRDASAAEEHLKSIREVFATSAEAARALLMLGNLYLELRRFSEADRCFQDVLGVREWRGPLWPEALYGRGECARLQRQFLQATAFYERIYVLYGNYREWCAKAYLQRAKCLLHLREDAKARETLEEMLSDPGLAALPESAEAREVLAQISRRGTP